MKTRIRFDLRIIGYSMAIVAIFMTGTKVHAESSPSYIYHSLYKNSESYKIVHQNDDKGTDDLQLLKEGNDTPEGNESDPYIDTYSSDTDDDSMND